jgi:glutaminyl-tRNA synthetase
LNTPHATAANAAAAATPAPVSNFIRHVVDTDLAQQRYAARRWAGQPGDAASHAHASPDPWPVRTRFPPEPNGYLHIGHAKSICLNFGLARDYGGVCHMRFDDTNPTKEDQEYVDSILDSVRWLGFDWRAHLYYASDYFETLYRFAEAFVEHGLAYVDSQSAEAIRAHRGTLTEPGTESPFRSRSVAENLDLLRRMRAGEFPDGEHVLRLKIDMTSPNINLRDPVIYRIRHAHHHRTGDAWCLYPLYDYTHGISDALENVTHSICTLEFEDHRPLYDWVLERLAEFGLLAPPLPKQYEFARLNLTYTVLSKRRLIQLVDEGHVAGWDDPRMPTLVGVRRRGFTPESLRLFAERIGVSKENSVIEMTILEDCVRDDLNDRAPRAFAVLDPLELVIDDWPAGHVEPCEAPVHPHHLERGVRQFPMTGRLWIEREDFVETPPKGFFRLYPGNRVRLRHGYVVECTGSDKDAEGRVVRVHCRHFADSKSGTAGAGTYKVKGTLHWVSAEHALDAEVRLYDRLFTARFPGSGDTDYLTQINPDSVRVLPAAKLEPGLVQAQPEDCFQFERHGYFVADPVDSRPGRPVFNRAVTLRDSWGKVAAGG